MTKWKILSTRTLFMNYFEYIYNTDKEFFDDANDAKEWYTSLFDSQDYHGGDCTKESYSCPLCTAERLLEEYREYVFEPDNK